MLLDLGAALAGIAIAFAAAPLLAPHLGWAAERLPAVQLYSVSILFMVTATPTGLLRLGTSIVSTCSPSPTRSGPLCG